MLDFFGWNINSAFVPSQYQSSLNVSGGNGMAFIQSIVPYVEGQASLDTSKDSPGSTPTQLQQGLKNYLTNKVGYVGAVNLFDLRTNRIPSVTQIKSGLPFILGLYETSGNPYGNHWVLGVGYVYMDSLDNMPLYYEVVNGWGQNDVYVNTGWTDYMISI